MKTPIDDFLSAQADMTAVERFARTDASGRSGRWSELIPLSTPSPGEHFRFEVDLDQCTGCKACVTACHNLNGLDVGESFRSVGVLVADPVRTQVTQPAQQTITTACHHCADPGCLNGCPAEAYEKDPVTGIVKHLDDACIGCRYCTLTCPYEVPVYNHRLGIVRKCDMCADRLSDGEAPACVQGCPTEAISISLASNSSVASTQSVVPGAAPSALTAPTTRYRGKALDSGAEAIDASAVEPQHAHVPLVVLLVLSQTSVGVVLAAMFLALGGMDDPFALSIAVGAILAICSVVASVGHLGQPRKAWRVILGWSHSWLSREALVLGGYLGAVLASVAALAIDRTLATVLLGAAVCVGLLAVFCSAMIYVVTGRVWWRFTETVGRFGGTVLLAASGWLSFAAVAEAEATTARLGAGALACVLAVKLWIEASAHRGDHVDLQRTSTLLRRDLSGLSKLRVVSGVIGAALILLGSFGSGEEPEGGAALVLIGLVLIVIGEISERRLFFQACAPRTMPGAHR